jgi:hypothetical protein
MYSEEVHAFKGLAVMFKLDIMKASVMVDWAFLLEVMAKLGFGRRLLSIVCGMLSTTSTRVVVNEIVGSLIYNWCELRQGSPLSHLLFDSMMDVLHLIFKKAAVDGLLAPLSSHGL